MGGNIGIMEKKMRLLHDNRVDIYIYICIYTGVIVPLK